MATNDKSGSRWEELLAIGAVAGGCFVGCGPMGAVVVVGGYVSYRVLKHYSLNRQEELKAIARHDHEQRQRIDASISHDVSEKARDRDREHQENMLRMQGWFKLEEAKLRLGRVGGAEGFEEQVRRIEAETEARRRGATIIKDPVTRKRALESVEKFQDDEIKKLFGKAK